ncbi:hypothetical protein EHZ19_00740 [Paraburkholderia bannensis]|nr:hypothetical protein EHZ19_00740 [Paraburkholderia bannensis]RQN40687.1 hypothetical protein EHZ25_04125 [Paraburkholderia tropica]
MSSNAQGPPRLALQPLRKVLADGSILVVRIPRRCMNSDAFFSFSAIRVHFSQVSAQAIQRMACAGGRCKWT